MLEPYLDNQPEIHPRAYVHTAATIIGRVKVEAEASIWPGAVLRADDGPILIRRQTSIQDGAVVHMTHSFSEVDIGERVTVGHNACLHGCRVGNESIVGMGSILMDNCEIGSHVIIGAGTVIPMRKKIPDGVLVFGNPYKIVRELTDKDLRFIEYSWKWYVEQGVTYAERDGRET